MEKEQYLDKLKQEMQKQNIEESQIKKCVEYAQKLLYQNLPVIFDLQHFCLLIGMDKNLVLSIIFANQRHLYKTLKVPKKSGRLSRIIHTNFYFKVHTKMDFNTYIG